MLQSADQQSLSVRPTAKENPTPPRYDLLKKRSYLSEDVRRDSGMASSISSTKTSASEPKVMDSSTSLGTASFNGPNNAPNPSKSQDGFSKIDTQIPTGELDNPFTSGKLAFSKRGSVLLNGKNVEIPRVEANTVQEENRLSQNVRSLYGNSDDQSDNLTELLDVNIQDIDRYGFIRPKSHASKRSSLSSIPPTSSEPRTAQQTNGLAPVYESPTSASDRPTTSRTEPRTRKVATGLPPLVKAQSLASNRSGRPPSTNKRASLIQNFRGQRWLRNVDEILASFPVDDDDAVEDIEPGNEDQSRLVERRRIDKWEKMARRVDTLSSYRGAGNEFRFNTSDPKLISRVWKGIPDRWRATAWHAFLTTSAMRRSSTGRPEPSDAALIRSFNELQIQDCEDDVQIDLDVPRTIGSHTMFRRRYHGGQRLLFRVLRALALYFPQVGYVQGMAAVVATLLCYYDEERAFVMAVRMWQLRGVGFLYGGNADDFSGLMSTLQEFEGWLKESNPKVIKQLEELGIGATSFGTKWYLTLFSYSVPFQTQLRIWDVFMLLGDPNAEPDRSNRALRKPDLSILHAVAAALIHGLQETLLDADFENAMKNITGSMHVRNDDVLMRVAKGEWSMRSRRLKRGRAGSS